MSRSRRHGGWRSFCFAPLQIGEPELDDSGETGVRQPRLLRRLERIEVALPHLLEGDALLERRIPVHEKPLYLRGAAVGL